MADSVKTIATNRRAFHDYAFDEKIECGVELVGTEVKSLRAGHVSFADAYARIRSGELWLVGLNIPPYSHASLFNHESTRERRLLIHKSELRRFKRRVDERGFTLIPTRLYFKGGLVKVELGLGKGKREYDKRQSIKQRDQGRDADREARDRFR
ncbi:MAG: SsrA-binding protein SmpB [Spirochaetaceae bacterium]|nr:MAG: SsrA-binding protein SmpB [Spirochaetaceae bacterium]